jgi:lysine-specific demethylase 8
MMEAHADAQLADLAKMAWRKGYRSAVDGCTSPAMRTRVQSLFRAMMTGKEPASARADADALLSGSTVDALAAGMGKEAHTLVRLALALFACEDDRLLAAVEHLDWALLTGMDRQIVGAIDALEAARAAAADAAAAAPSAAAPSVAEAALEAHWHIAPVSLPAVRAQLRLPPADELQRLPAGELSVEAFRTRFLTARKPVVVAGVASGWPAVERWADLQYWLRTCGHRIIPVELGRSALDAGRGSWREQGMSIGAFVRDHLLPSSRADHAAAALEAGRIGYCAQHQLFEQVGALAADFAPPAYCGAARGGVQLVNCWLGTRETTTPLHFDSYDNCLVQVVGLKLVRLYECDQTSRLYACGAGAADVGAQGNVSAVDVDAPDLERFPRFAEAVGRWCLLGPGDMLFIPEGCWHHVRSLSTSCSVNFWF